MTDDRTQREEATSSSAGDPPRTPPTSRGHEIDQGPTGPPGPASAGQGQAHRQSLSCVGARPDPVHGSAGWAGQGRAAQRSAPPGPHWGTTVVPNPPTSRSYIQRKWIVTFFITGVFCDQTQNDGPQMSCHALDCTVAIKVSRETLW